MVNILKITSRLNQELDITGLPPSFYMNPPELFIRNNKKWSMFLNTISLKNMQIVILLLQLHHDSIRNRQTGLPPSFYMNPPEWNNKKMVIFLTQFHSHMQIVILLLRHLNQELDITGLPPSFYMNPPELFTRNNKKWSMF